MVVAPCQQGRPAYYATQIKGCRWHTDELQATPQSALGFSVDAFLRPIVGASRTPSATHQWRNHPRYFRNGLCTVALGFHAGVTLTDSSSLRNIDSLVTDVAGSYVLTVELAKSQRQFIRLCLNTMLRASVGADQ